jgi:hypothetical protein
MMLVNRQVKHIFTNSKNMATKTIKTVSIKMTFAYSMSIMIMTLESGTATGKKIARAELMKYAKELDRLAENNKK